MRVNKEDLTILFQSPGTSVLFIQEGRKGIRQYNHTPDPIAAGHRLTFIFYESMAAPMIPASALREAISILGRG